MDTQPSTSHYDKNTALLSPTKKRPRKALTITEKLMISNAYKYVYQEQSEKLAVFEVPKKDECVTKVAKILGIAKRTVYVVLKEFKENKDTIPKPPKKPGPKKGAKKQEKRKEDDAPSEPSFDTSEILIKKEVPDEPPQMSNYSVDLYSAVVKEEPIEPEINIEEPMLDNVPGEQTQFKEEPLEDWQEEPVESDMIIHEPVLNNVKEEHLDIKEEPLEPLTEES